MCFRCVKACKNGSPEFNLRPPGMDFGLPFLLPVPGTELPSTFTAHPWQAALMTLLQGAVYVHYIPRILSDFGVDPTVIASAQFGGGAPFVWHSLITAGLLVAPAALILAADTLARQFDEPNLLEGKGSGGSLAMLTESEGIEGLTRTLYGYLPLVWTSNLAYWLGNGMAEGGTVFPRLAATVGLQSLEAGLPQVVFGHDAITLVQGACLLSGLPLAYFLTQKLCDENNFGRVRHLAHFAMQALLVGELWHLIMH